MQMTVNRTRSYAALLARGRARWGERWDPSDLDAAAVFHRPYESGARIEVRFAGGDILRGRVGVTGGWRPVFLLLRTVRSVGSSDLLRYGDDVQRTVAP